MNLMHNIVILVLIGSIWTSNMTITVCDSRQLQSAVHRACTFFKRDKHIDMSATNKSDHRTDILTTILSEFTPDVPNVDTIA